MTSSPRCELTPALRMRGLEAHTTFSALRMCGLEAHTTFSALRRMFLRGMPSDSSNSNGGQSVSHPQLAGVSGVMWMFFSVRMLTQFPVEPVCGQDAPPSAMMVAVGGVVMVSPMWEKVRRC